MSEKSVIILRGPSGSGKSTYSKNFPDAVVVSADNFFLRFNPETQQKQYVFDPTKLGEAHAKCLCRFIDAIRDNVKCIIVDNTNIHKWEYQSYSKIAEQAGYKVKIVQFKPKTIRDIRTCIQRTIHRVPSEIIARMCIEFEDDLDLVWEDKKIS